MNPPINEELELSKTLYELTGWQYGDSTWLWVEAHQEYERNNGTTLNKKHPAIPDYSLEYLLSQLPDRNQDGIHASFWVGLPLGGKAMWWSATWECDTGEYYVIEKADTPKLAVLKLSIELAKKGLNYE